MKTYLKYLIIFVLGGAGYSLIEIMWRGYTHISMTVTGGLCICALWFFNERLRCGVIFKAVTGAVFITAVELVAGIILNMVMGLGVWDYSRLPFNFMGQICLSYTFYWFVLCLLFYEALHIIESFKKLRQIRH